MKDLIKAFLCVAALLVLWIVGAVYAFKWAKESRERKERVTRAWIEECVLDIIHERDLEISNTKVNDITRDVYLNGRYYTNDDAGDWVDEAYVLELLGVPCPSLEENNTPYN